MVHMPLALLCQKVHKLLLVFILQVLSGLSYALHARKHQQMCQHSKILHLEVAATHRNTSKASAMCHQHCFIAGTRLCFTRVDHPDTVLTAALPWMRKHAAVSDIMVLNFGLHGMLPPDAYAVAHYLKAYRDDLPFVLWKDVSATHCNSTDGSFSG